MERAEALDRLKRMVQDTVAPTLSAAELDYLLDDALRGTVWAASYPYKLSAVVVPTRRNGHKYRLHAIGSPGSAPKNTTQAIVGVGHPTSGTFTVRITNPSTGVAAITAALNWNATAAQVQAAIDTAIGSGNATVTGGPLPDAPIAIAFSATYAPDSIALIVITSSLAGNPNAGLQVYVPGVSDADQPNWPTRPGAFVSEGEGETQITWQEDGPDFDDQFWDLGSAAYEGWMLKADKAYTSTDFKTQGKEFKDSQLYEHCLRQAEKHRPVILV